MSTRFFHGSVIHNQHDPLNKGLVGEWRFDRHAGDVLRDYSGYGYHGDFVGPPVWVTTQYGPALSFDGGNDYVDMGDVLDFTSEYFTLEAFFNRTGASPGGQAVTIVGKEMVTNNQYILEVQNNDLIRVLTFGLADNSIESIATITNGLWYHVVFTWDGATKTIYLNGEFDNSEATAGVMVVNADSLKIGLGRGTGNAFNYFYGLIANVRIYERALSPAEVRARYQMILRRMQTFGGERRFPVGLVTAVPPVGPFLTTGGGYSLPVG